MKIMCDLEQILDITDTMKKIIEDDVVSEKSDSDIKRRIAWVIEHKIAFNMKRLKAIWIPRLKERGIKSIPTDDIELAEIIFAQPDYKNATQKELEREKSIIGK